jgi:hypothetical protein
MACVLTSGVIARARASVGGPELAEPLGYDPRTHEAFFRQDHCNESDARPTICRLALRRGTRVAEPLAWSIGEDSDPAYVRRVAVLRRRLRPLRPHTAGTIPGVVTIEHADSVTVYGERWARFRVRAGWFDDAPAGDVTVTAYRDPAVRVVAWFDVPGESAVIGVVSYVGVPDETGYEQQVPVVFPAERQALTIPDAWWRTGYPPSAVAP